MAQDDELAHRVRELLGEEDGLSEQRMFGGLAFLLHGNMAVAVSTRGLLVRVGPEGAQAALAKPGAEEMKMGQRAMRGWIRVDPDALATQRQLRPWVHQGVRLARSLAPKG
jgi:TfoX/Sxy family transcriptional regulator of competence genes